MRRISDVLVDSLPGMGGALRFDVLVIGSGASGLAATLSAARAGARVGLATKGSIQSCNSAKAQGGIQAAFGADDSPEQHAADVWRSSHETADRALVEILTGEAPAAIAWLEEAGVEFTREITSGAHSFAPGGTRGRAERPVNGGYRIARCGGASRKRLLQVGDRTGHAITKALREAVEATAVHVLPRSPLTELAQAESGWRARCGEHEIEAGAVALAAGGRCFREAEERGELTTNHPGATGEVTRIALDAGAEARDLDALQYHPNGGAWPETMQGYSIPETTRAYGAVLLNADGEEFTDSLGPRDEVSQAIVDEVAAGRGTETPDGRPAVWLDTTRIPESDAAISLPYMLRRYRSAGIDPLAEKILTYPVLHYQNGGLVIDGEGETTLEGLYACGEIAGGTHGRNRMMGNSLLECVVFGRRAGRAAAGRAAS
jgi:L-aspartate oxidase